MNHGFIPFGFALLVEVAHKYEEILKLAPDASDAWRGLGMVYYRQERWDWICKNSASSKYPLTLNPSGGINWEPKFTPRACRNDY
ncbi:type IV pilus biogenesis/stability protein PilW [[Phormidium] sp. ETS-05]|uniref:tetratricopeptide repeat protein n=1 Tax=[Phormidium] sp. ETS-05 TaxID=222819 RepID=UPI0018EF08E0|nr:tetratricopeptide repeat protein [[Phormidium] sp. ETS-05]